MFVLKGTWRDEAGQRSTQRQGSAKRVGVDPRGAVRRAISAEWMRTSEDFRNDPIEGGAKFEQLQTAIRKGKFCPKKTARA